MMREVLGSVDDYTVKEAWDVLQGEQRRLHLDGRRLESEVCRDCHHGAVKKRIAVSIDDEHRRDDFTYVENENSESETAERIEN
jgi:hypothetical protein